MIINQLEGVAANPPPNTNQMNNDFEKYILAIGFIGNEITDLHNFDSLKKAEEAAKAVLNDPFADIWSLCICNSKGLILKKYR